MHRCDIDFEKYEACSSPRYQSIDGTMKQCLVFRDDEGSLYLAPKADMLKQKEVVRETYATYALVYNKPDPLGNAYTQETVNMVYYEKLKQMEIIVDFVVDDRGVKVFRYK
jgi:hypothetical protein